ncbi:MAG: type IV pilus assembly protein PilM [Gemmatimonadetes bacterium]|nr:type IV pilus assembly protein PilM [Gemmatimonadota bacterium]NIU77514.1 type IV pilus assembly protein PilM [Gammaproteobacteria bacterium]NIX46722.1 type IV pilus assembly protein PilM [Gemmatimonadota bacterium]
MKLVVVDHAKGDPEITKIATSPLVQDAIVEGEVMDPVLVAETIRSVVSEADLSKKEVVAAVGGHDVIIKKIQMDRMDEAEARELIRWEAHQHVPFDMESVQLDFQILDPGGSDPQMSVLLVAAKRELIENRLTLLADAGLSPAMIDVDAFALHNAFEQSYPDSMAGMVALVNIGHETTNVNILEEGVPIVVRDIPFGSRRIREALQRERGFTADQAEAVIQGHQKAEDLESFVVQRVDELAVGIERAIAFITAQSGGEGIDQVYLSGGGARVPGVVHALGERLGVATHMANPLERLAVRPEVNLEVAVDEVAPMLMLPVGLAMRRP